MVPSNDEQDFEPSAKDKSKQEYNMSDGLKSLWRSMLSQGPFQLMVGTWAFVQSTVSAISESKLTPLIVAGCWTLSIFLLMESSKWKSPQLGRAITAFVLFLVCISAYQFEQSITKFEIFPYAAFVGQTPTPFNPKSKTIVVFILSIQNSAEGASIHGYGCSAKSKGRLYLGTTVRSASSKVGYFISTDERRIFEKEKELPEQIKGHTVPSRERVSGWLACTFEANHDLLRAEDTLFTLSIRDDRRKQYSSSATWELPTQSNALRRHFDDLNLLPAPNREYQYPDWSNIYIHYNGLLKSEKD